MRLVDADKLFPDVMKVDGSMAISQGQLAHAHTVEAILKADYENRLKADMVAMLTEIQLKIEEIPNSYEHKPIGTYDYCFGAKHERKVNLEIIQQKINALKGDQAAG